MSTASRRKGAGFELDVLKYLRDKGFDVERLRLAGSEDEGDLVVKDGAVHIIEAKAENKVDLPGYLREAEAEAANYGKHRNLSTGAATPVVVIKRRNHGIAQAYVVQTLAQYFNIKDA